VGSVIQSADTTALVEFAMSQKVQITTTSVNEVYKLQFKNTAVGIATLHNNSVDGNSNVLYQQIPDSTIINVDPTLVTPDLLSRTTVTGITSAAITGAGTPLIFTTVQGVAGIPYDPSTGFFSLTANNTYRLQATFKLTSGNPKMGWCEASSSVALIPGTDLASAGTALTTETVELVYTPTVNMDVKCAATTASALTINTFSGYAIAEQLSMSTITQVDPTLLTPVDLDYLSLTTDEAGNGNRGISTLVTTIGSGYRALHLANTNFVGRTLDTNSIIDAGGYHVVIKKSGLYEMSVGYAQDNDDAEPAVFVNGVILVGAMTFATTWTHSTASGIKYLNIGDTVEFGHLNTTPRSVNGAWITMKQLPLSTVTELDTVSTPVDNTGVVDSSILKWSAANSQYEPFVKHVWNYHLNGGTGNTSSGGNLNLSSVSTAAATHFYDPYSLTNAAANSVVISQDGLYSVGFDGKTAPSGGIALHVNGVLKGSSDDYFGTSLQHYTLTLILPLVATDVVEFKCLATTSYCVMATIEQIS
jgi:hypothetical protein